MTALHAKSVDLSQLFAGMDVAAPPIAVTNIASNSRDVEPGGLFLACAGAERHGLHYLRDAVAAGAVAVAWEPGPGVTADNVPPALPCVQVPGLRAKLGLLGDRFFDAPSAGLRVTGITGTNGKTTVAFLVSQALNRLGTTCAYMGTLGYGIRDQLRPSALTTPGCITMHRRLREMLDGGAEHVIAEVSSHALDQGRVDGVRLKVAALTNLARDHLDYHGSMERYAEAKARLFQGTGIQRAVINVGDRFGARLAGRLSGGVDVISVALVDTSRDAPDARLVGRLSAVDAQGIGLRLQGDFGEALLTSPLWGRFNGENLVVAVGILLAHDIPLESAVGALTECFAPPGRMERIATADGEKLVGRPAVIVDFAHTPDALAEALRAVRAHVGTGAVWCVFGCGGDRDRGKRAAMGAVAADLADHVVVTDDNPRGENPRTIIDAILAGMPVPERAAVLPDRADAIRFAIDAAGPDDVVLIAGKGHETVQIRGAQTRPFSDASVAHAALEARP